MGCLGPRAQPGTVSVALPLLLSGGDSSEPSLPAALTASLKEQGIWVFWRKDLSGPYNRDLEPTWLGSFQGPAMSRATELLIAT